jgi:hypothetical protein
MTAEELHQAQSDLDKRLTALEEASAKNEQTQPRNWLPIALPIAGTVITAIITAGVTLAANSAQRHETERAANAQTEQTKRAEFAAQQQQAVENGRAAATMYFANLADLRRKDTMSPAEKKRFVRDLEILAAISGNDDLKEIMTRASRDAAVSFRNERTEQSAAQGGATTLPSSALQALPDLAPAKTVKTYTPADFLAYPEVPLTRWSGETQAFRNALSNLGFGTQLAEKIRPELAPQKNEVRYYKPDHAKVAAYAAAQLTKALHQRFVPRLLGGAATLPNGVMEFWLGTNPDPA